MTTITARSLKGLRINLESRNVSVSVSFCVELAVACVLGSRPTSSNIYLRLIPLWDPHCFDHFLRIFKNFGSFYLRLFCKFSVPSSPGIDFALIRLPSNAYQATGACHGNECSQRLRSSGLWPLVFAHTDTAAWSMADWSLSTSRRWRKAASASQRRLLFPRYKSGKKLLSVSRVCSLFRRDSYKPVVLNIFFTAPPLSAYPLFQVPLAIQISCLANLLIKFSMLYSAKRLTSSCKFIDVPLGGCPPIENQWSKPSDSQPFLTDGSSFSKKYSMDHSAVLIPHEQLVQRFPTFLWPCTPSAFWQMSMYP